MTVGNYVRNLSGVSPADPCWPCQPAAACTAAWPSGPSAPSGALDTSWAGSLMGSAREGLRLRARKSSPRALKMAQIRRFYACWANFFAEEPPEGPCRANFFAEEPREGPCWASFFVPTGAVPSTCRRCGALRAGCGGGFALHEAFLRRVASVSDPRVVQFPPTGDGEAAVCSAGAPKPQTTSVKNTENGLLVARWSVFWAQRCLSWRVARTQTRYVECGRGCPGAY